MPIIKFLISGPVELDSRAFFVSRSMSVARDVKARANSHGTANECTKWSLKSLFQYDLAIHKSLFVFDNRQQCVFE